MLNPRLIWEDVGAQQRFLPLLERQRLMRQTWPAGTHLRTHVLTCSHTPTITFGYRCAVESQLLVPRPELEKKGVELVECERGGFATYHGPGQLMIYPMLSLPAWGLGVRDYIELLEEATVQTVRGHGVKATPGALKGPGVWCGEAKIASIGVHLRKGIPIQGLCLNLSGDLTPFSWILACGERDLRVTHLEKASGSPTDRLKIAEQWVEHFWRLLQEKRLLQETQKPEILQSFGN